MGFFLAEDEPGRSSMDIGQGLLPGTERWKSAGSFAYVWKAISRRWDPRERKEKGCGEDRASSLNGFGFVVVMGPILRMQTWTKRGDELG